MPVLEPDEVAVGARLEPDRAVRRGGAGAELAGLRDRPGRELGATDPGREAEVVLDPARRARLAAECAALDDERVESLGRAVDRCTEPCGTAPDDHEVDLLAWSELEPDPERPRHLTRRRIAELRPAWKPHERQLVVPEPFDQGDRRHVVSVARVQPRRGQPVPAGELDHPPGRVGGLRPDDVHADAVAALQALAAGDERRQQEIAEWPVLEQQRLQRFTLHGDVAHRPGHDGRQVDGLAGEQVRLAEESGRAVPDDLAACGVEDRCFALDDRDQRVAAVADLEQDVADLCPALLTVLGEQRQLTLREHRRRRGHPETVSTEWLGQSPPGSDPDS